MSRKLTRLSLVELYKVTQKKESYLLLALCLLPLIFAIGLYSGSSSFIFSSTKGAISCLDWVSSMTTILNQSLIFYFFLTIIVTRSLSSEIEDHSILLYIPRVNSRRLIYSSKILAGIASGTFAIVSFLVSSIASYYIFLIHVPEVANGNFTDKVTIESDILNIFTVYVCVLVVAMLAHCLSNYMKPLLCIAVAIVVIGSMPWLIRVNGLAYLLPWFYMTRMNDLFNNVSQDSMAIHLFSAKPTLVFLLYLTVSVIWIATFFIAGLVKFVRRDL